jgi:CRISPR/Cas system CSM-associated protein Csm2 small subunit
MEWLSKKEGDGGQIDTKQIPAIFMKNILCYRKSLMGEKRSKKDLKIKVIMVMYFLYKNEHRTLKPIEITIWRGLR